MALKQDPEDENSYLEWGLTLISMSQQYSTGTDSLYAEAEQKIYRSCQLGNQQAFYHLSCIYALRGLTEKAMYFLEKAADCDILPPIEEMQEDLWLENLQITDEYNSFIKKLEEKEENIRDEKKNIS